jgi:hypothetical protein
MLLDLRVPDAKGVRQRLLVDPVRLILGKSKDRKSHFEPVRAAEELPRVRADPGGIPIRSFHLDRVETYSA